MVETKKAGLIVKAPGCQAGGFLFGSALYRTCRELCDRHESLFIMDEVVTGFRVAMGGAQELYGVDAYDQPVPVSHKGERPRRRVQLDLIRLFYRWEHREPTQIDPAGTLGKDNWRESDIEIPADFHGNLAPGVDIEFLPASAPAVIIESTS